MPDPNGFLRYDRRLPARRPVPVRISDWREVYPPAGDGADPRAGHPLHGLRHPVLPRRLPAGQPHPGLERPGAHRQLGRRRSSRCTPPTTSRSSPAGSARRRARRPACSASPAASRSPSSRSRSRSSTGRSTAALVTPQPVPAPSGRRSPSSAPGPAGLAAAQQLARAGHAVTVYERDDAIGGLLRYGIPDFKLEKRHIDRRLAQLRRRGRAVPHRRERRRRRDRRAAARRARRGAAGLRRAGGPGHPGRPRAGRCGAYTWRWSTWSRPQPGGAPVCDAPTRPDRRGRQARGDHRWWRHRRRLPRRGAPAGRGRRAPARPLPAAAAGARRAPGPVADLAVDPAQLPGARGGRRAGLRRRGAGVRRRRHRPGPGGADRRGDA